jgi:hypothetical protein
MRQKDNKDMLMEKGNDICSQHVRQTCSHGEKFINTKTEKQPPDVLFIVIPKKISTEVSQVNKKKIWGLNKQFLKQNVRHE